MELDRSLRRRLLVGVLVAGLLSVVAFVGVAFVDVLVLSVFLYYSVRPLFNRLGEVIDSRQVRAALSILLFGLPFVLLIIYTVSVIVLEVQEFIRTVPAIDTELITELLAEFDVLGINPSDVDDAFSDVDPGSLRDMADGVDWGPIVDQLAGVVGGLVGIVGALVVRILLVAAIVYYMLVDGPQLLAWLLDEYDEDGVLRRYARVVDPELSLTLFGNIVNVFIAAIITIVVFQGFNFLAPEALAIPFPTLAGAIAGVATLIPVVGIKLVYIPATLVVGVNAWLTGDTTLLAWPVGLLVASLIFVDTIPEFFIRARVSGDATHNGLLLIAYIIGPNLFGFYGLFLAPIVLILTIGAIEVLLPYALTGEPGYERQTTLDEFEGPPPQLEGADTGDSE